MDKDPKCGAKIAARQYWKDGCLWTCLVEGGDLGQLFSLERNDEECGIVQQAGKPTQPQPQPGNVMALARHRPQNTESLTWKSDFHRLAAEVSQPTDGQNFFTSSYLRLGEAQREISLLTSTQPA